MTIRRLKFGAERVKGIDFRGGNTVKIILSPSDKGSALKGKNLLREQILSF